MCVLSALLLAGGAVTIGDTTFTPTAITNKAGRTLQGFGTESTTSSKMFVTSASCPGCPYKTFSAFELYYGNLDYADKWVTAALDGTNADFATNGDADFSLAPTTDFDERVEAVQKGTV